MTAFYVFAAFSSLFAFVFLFFLDLTFFYKKWNGLFAKSHKEKAFVTRLENTHKKVKNPIKKNFLFYLLLLTLSEVGEKEKAKSLLPFLKDDPFMGIKKSRISFESC